MEFVQRFVHFCYGWFQFTCMNSTLKLWDSSLKEKGFCFLYHYRVTEVTALDLEWWLLLVIIITVQRQLPHQI